MALQQAGAVTADTRSTAGATCYSPTRLTTVGCLAWKPSGVAAMTRDLALADPGRGESAIERRDEPVELSLSGFPVANLGSHPRHRPKTDNLLAFRAGPQPRPESCEIASDLLTLVGQDAAEVRRLCGVRRPSNTLRTCHRGNLAGRCGGRLPNAPA